MSETIQETSPHGWMPYLPAAPGRPQPWPRRLTWMVSLWALAAAVFVTLMWGIPKIESRLDQQSRAQLDGAGIDASTLNLRWSYRDVAIHGELPPGVSAQQLEEILRRGQPQRPSFIAQGIRQIDIFATPAARDIAAVPVESVSTEPNTAIVVAPLDTSLQVAINMQRNTAVIDGMVQSTEQRRTLVDALLTTGVENIQDNLEVLDIVDDSSNAKIEVLAGMLQQSSVEHVSQFTANLDTNRLDYRVITNDKGNAAGIENAATAAIIDFNISGQTTVAQTGVVDVQVTRDGPSLTLQGQVLTEEQRKRLSFAAREVAGDPARVIDQVGVSDEAARIPGSDARVDGLAEIISQLRTGVSGSVNLTGSDLTVDAAVSSDELKASLQEVAASARKRGITVSEYITVRNDSADTDQAQQAIVSLQSKLNAMAAQVHENVVFNSGNATLTSDAKLTLNQVVDVLQDFPQLKVEVEGHTDSVGRESVNEKLSLDRAEAVMQYLVAQSVDATRLVAVGYGSRLPLASNDTSEGRKRNRRVHFTVPDQTHTE